MYQPLTEELREILERHRQWVDLMNRNPLMALVEEQMKLRADLNNRDLKGYDFSYINLNYANLSGTDFSRCRLNNAELKGAYLKNAIFEDARMISATLRCSYAQGASFLRAILTQSDLAHTILFDTDFTGADINDVKFHGSFMNENTKGLDDVKGADFRFFHPGKSDLVAIQLMKKARGEYNRV